LPTGELVELVYQASERRTLLAVGSHLGCALEDSIEFGGMRLVPLTAENNLLKHEALLLPEYPAEYNSIEELCQEIEDYLALYVDLPDNLRKVAIAYILLTWVYDAFNELPYLRFRGDLGSGKTRALIIIGGLCNRAFFASGASTVSPIFHTLDTFQGTLILDEADFRFSDEKAELSKILNNGNVRGFPVLRTAMTAKKEFDPRAFSVYGPKVIAMRGNFDDPVLESRFITINMEPGPMASHIPINLPDEQKDEARELRNKLLGYRFENRMNVSIDESLYDPALTPRANQVTLPLLSILDDQLLHATAKEIVSQTHADTLADRAASPAGILVALLVDLARAGDRRYVGLSQVTGSFIERAGREIDRPITNRYVGSLLRRALGIRTYKSHGTYQVPLEAQRLAKLGARYGVEIPEPKGGRGDVGITATEADEGAGCGVER
jgi:hypothetical protein